jgi:hypothetical protein
MRCLFICSPTSGLLIKFIWRQRACDENLDPAAATVAAYPKNSLILCSWAHDWRKSLPYLLTSPTKTFPVIPILLPIHNLVLAAFHRRTPPPLLLLPLRHPHPRATSSWLPSSASREEANGRRRILAGIVGGGSSRPSL